MTAVVFLGALALLTASGYCCALPSVRGRPVIYRLALAHLCGAAALALGVTAGVVLADHVSLRWGAAGLAVAGLTGVLIGRTKTEAPREHLPEPAPVPLVDTRAGIALLGILTGAGILTAVLRVAMLPLDWDGWAIWQLKAKAMADGSLRHLLTSPDYGYAHPDYPLLLPAHTWWLSGGGFHEDLAQLGGLLFFLDLAALFYHEAAARVSRGAALLGCVVLVSWPLTVKHAASGFADVPMAAYALLAVAALVRSDLRLLAAGLTGALLTKNEGLFTLAAAILIVTLITAQRPTASARRLPLVLAALATGAVVAGGWALVKARWGLRGDLLDPARWPPDLLSVLPERMVTVAAGFAAESVRVGPRYPGWGLLWPFAALGLWLSVRRGLAETAPLWSLVAVHFAGAAAAYLVTPLDPAGHMATSLDRLMLHVAPAALLAALVAVAGSQAAGPLHVSRDAAP
jgi:hypothetical protein